MSFTYGFYNSVNHDRVYDARQLGALFDGIINDGVYESQGERFMVRPASAGMAITVGAGRAWFNHTWSYNDSLLPLTIVESDVLLNRIDAVVLETNTSSSVRSNSIKVITGLPAETPSKPTMVREEFINQYPLAYISVPANTTAVDQANIEYVVGSSATPFVTGIIETTDIDDMVAQWEAEWENFIRTRMTDFDNWSDEQKAEFMAWVAVFEADSLAWFTSKRAEFMAWFRNIQYVLDGDAAGHLQDEIDDLHENLQGQIDDIIENLPIKVINGIPCMEWIVEDPS